MISCSEGGSGLLCLSQLSHSEGRFESNPAHKSFRSPQAVCACTIKRVKPLFRIYIQLSGSGSRFRPFDECQCISGSRAILWFCMRLRVAECGSVSRFSFSRFKDWKFPDDKQYKIFEENNWQLCISRSPRRTRKQPNADSGKKLNSFRLSISPEFRSSTKTNPCLSKLLQEGILREGTLGTLCNPPHEFLYGLNMDGRLWS